MRVSRPVPNGRGDRASRLRGGGVRMEQHGISIVEPDGSRAGRARRLRGRCRALAEIAFALTLLVSALAAGSAAGETRTVRVGLYENEPKIFTDASGHPSGFFADLITEIAGEEGWKLVWVPGTWDEGIKALEEGRIDLMPDVAYSAERAEIFDFHKTPVVESWSYVYAAPGVRLDSITDLAGDRVAVLRGSIQETVFKRMVDGFGYDVTLVPVDSLKEAFRLAADAKVDAAIANGFFGDYSYQEYGLTKTPIVFNAISLFYATGKGRNADLLAAIDRHLDAWVRVPGSPYYRALGTYTSKTPVGGIPKWVWWTAGIGAALLVLAGGIILLLRWQVRLRTRHLREANAALAKTEEELRLAIEASQEGIFDWNIGDDTSTWSPHAYNMLGYTPGDLPMGRMFLRELLHPDDVTRVLAEAYDGMRSADRTFGGEFRLRTKSGEWLWVESHGKAVAVAEDGTPQRVMGTIADISKRKLAEAALAESESRYRSIVETSSNGVFLLDCEGAIRMANASAARMRGNGGADLPARRFADLLVEEDREAFERMRLESPNDAEPRHYSVTMLRADGTTFPAEMSAAMVTDAAERPISVVVTVRDISERQAVERAKSDFLSAISHELRTPLTVILGACELAQRVSPLEQPGLYERLLSTIQDRAHAMTHLVDDLLNATRSAPEQFDLVLVEADLSDIVTRCATRVPPSDEHEVIVRVDDGLPPCACDPRRLEYAVSNLVENAVKYSPEGGTITIEAGRGDGMFFVRVSDEGVGIAADQLDTIFEPFTQGDMSSTREFGGVGLGLFVAKNMVESHGGRITVESVPGKGSAFTIEIPCTDVRQESAPPTSAGG